MNRRDWMDAETVKRLTALARAIFFTLLFVTSGLYISQLVTDVASAWVGTPLEFRNLPWETQNADAHPHTVFRPGETVYVKASFRVAYAGQFRSQQLIVSTDRRIIRRVTDVETAISPGTFQTNGRAAVLPNDLAPGEYRVEGMTTLSNWMRTFTANWQTAVFTVVVD
jgi:hypothetical protein